MDFMDKADYASMYIEEMKYKINSLIDENCYYRNKVKELNYLLSDEDEFLRQASLESFVDFFRKNPEIFNKINSKLRKDKIEKIESEKH